MLHEVATFDSVLHFSTFMLGTAYLMGLRHLGSAYKAALGRRCRHWGLCMAGSRPSKPAALICLGDQQTVTGIRCLQSHWSW